MRQALEIFLRDRRASVCALLLYLSASLAACGTPPQAQPTSLTPAPAPLVRSDVLILPLGQKSQEELEYWTSENQRLVLAYFDIFLRHGFGQATTDRVIVPNATDEVAGLEFAFESTDQGNGQEWWSFLPQAGRVQHRGQVPDYVLIFDGLRFRIRSGGGSRQTYDVPGSGKVELDLEFVLWDNTNQSIAASGRLHQESQTSSPHPSSELFKRLFERMAEDIVRRTPINS